MDCNARSNDPYINHFIQPDSIVPGAENPQSWNRYSYTLNSPINNNDPSRYCVEPVTFLIYAGVIGAAVSVTVDAFVTTQINHEDNSWEQAGKAALLVQSLEQQVPLLA